MIKFVGGILVMCGILCLFALGRDKKTRVSHGLWIPIIWFFIAGSRPISLWFNWGWQGAVDRATEGSPFDRNIFTALILIGLIVLVRRSVRLGTLVRANLPILLFLFYCGVSIFWSDFSDIAFKRWIRAVGDVVMVLVILTETNPLAAIKELFARLSFIIIPLSVLFDIGRGSVGRDYHFGLTTNKNMYGLISMVLGLALVWRFLNIWKNERDDRGRRLLAYGSVLVMTLWCLWMANSTTALGCFALGSFLIFCTTKFSFARQPAAVYMVVPLLIFAALYATILNPNLGLVASMGKDPTLTGRTEVWKTVIALNPNPLIGAGFESFWLGPRLTKIWNIFVWFPNEAHNGYIEVYLNLGIVGLVMLGLILVTGGRKVISSLRFDAEMGSLRLAIFVVAIVYNFTEAGFRIFSPIWLAFLLSVAALSRVRRKPAQSPLKNPVAENATETLAAAHRAAAMGERA